MSSKTHRRKVRDQRRRRHPHAAGSCDPHGKVILQSMAGMLDAASKFARSDDPGAALDVALSKLVEELATRFCGIHPMRVIETARLACLPWSWGGQPAHDGSQAGPTQLELITLIAITAAQATDRHANLNGATVSGDVPSTDGNVGHAGFGRAQAAEPDRIVDVVSDALPLIDQILELGQLREITRADRKDPLAMIATMVRGSEVWIRNTSYPDMVSAVLSDLFSEPSICTVLRSDLGFDAQDALAVLSGCHDLQVNRLNERMQHMGSAISSANRYSSIGTTNDNVLTDARRSWDALWEPDIEAATVSAEEITAATGLPITVVEAVLTFFTLDLSEETPQKVVDSFSSGLSPLRISPIVASNDGRVMLVHDALNLVAVRARIESHLKSTASWETYQKHRGELLESRTQMFFARLFPNARAWNAFHYYVPNNHIEAAGDPVGYTKRVEGDHLIIQDDVAIIVEDKAVAWSGQSQRLRRDLIGIIRKAADQATRLQERIQQDGGIRVHDQGWVDLSRIREVHTVAVSLDDLSGASTATAELMKAQLLDLNHIPWTVSIHDLDLITQLVDRPAEFLLYLRRRRDPEATIFYTAPDELDLFLYYFEAGLYVEPDPDKIRVAHPWMTPPTTAERRRRRAQRPAYITSRTDSLDLWHQASTAGTPAKRISEDLEVSAHGPDHVPDGPANANPQTEREKATGHSATEDADPAPSKPTMSPSPLEWLVDAVQERGDYAWLSIGATLLSGSTAFQNKVDRIPRDLLDNPFGDGRQRSATLPFPDSSGDGWLMVWITRPPERDSLEFEKNTRDYLCAKKHQLGLSRGVAFCFDEATRELSDVYFDDHIGDLEPDVAARLSTLKPPEHMPHWPPPHAKIRPGSKQRTGNSSRNKSKKH